MTKLTGRVAVEFGCVIQRASRDLDCGLQSRFDEAREQPPSQSKAEPGGTAQLSCKGSDSVQQHSSGAAVILVVVEYALLDRRASFTAPAIEPLH